MSRLLYSLAWYLGTPLVMLHLWLRARSQPEYRRHWRERWALGLKPRAPGPLIWIHAVSVGETRAAQPLIDAIGKRFGDAQLLLTCMTPTGRETGAQLFGGRVLQSYLPYDYPDAIDRFLRAWRPSVSIIMETELWPNLMAGCVRHEIGVCLVNARLSPRSLRKGLRWSRLITPALRRLRVIAAQTEADAGRLAELGGSGVVVTGNMKFDIAPSPQAVALGRSWRARLGRRPVIVAASTRDGEERELLAAWRRHAGAAPAPLLLIVPRHPQRFDEVCALAAADGLRVQRRSRVLAQGGERVAQPAAGVEGPSPRADDDSPMADVDVLIGDSMGEMFAYYELADLAILGGSLLPHGGQNLIEPCAVGTPVIMGPHTFNFDEAAQQAIAHDAALRVDDADGAVALVLKLLADDARREAIASAAMRFAAAHRGATEKTVAAIASELAAALTASPGRPSRQERPAA